MQNAFTTIAQSEVSSLLSVDELVSLLGPRGHDIPLFADTSRWILNTRRTLRNRLCVRNSFLLCITSKASAHADPEQPLRRNVRVRGAVAAAIGEPERPTADEETPPVAAAPVIGGQRDVDPGADDVGQSAAVIKSAIEDLRSSLGLLPADLCVIPRELVGWAFAACVSICVVSSTHTDNTESASAGAGSTVMSRHTFRGNIESLVDAANDVVSSYRTHLNDSPLSNPQTRMYPINTPLVQFRGCFYVSKTQLAVPTGSLKAIATAAKKAFNAPGAQVSTHVFESLPPVVLSQHSHELLLCSVPLHHEVN